MSRVYCTMCNKKHTGEKNPIYMGLQNFQWSFYLESRMVVNKILEFIYEST